jgi:acyl-CoA dehydrogenase
VLSLDAVLRGELARGLPALRTHVEQCVGRARDPRLRAAGATALAAVEHAGQSLRQQGDAVKIQANARRLALTLGRALELALLVEHGQWELDALQRPSGVAAAARFAVSPIDLLAEVDPEDSAQLVRE